MEKVKCPYCFQEHSYELEALPWDENEEEQKECLFCDKTYIVTVECSYRWDSKPIEEDE